MQGSVTMFSTNPIQNQGFNDLPELWDSYKSRIALVIQRFKLQQEDKIPAEVTVEQMTRCESSSGSQCWKTGRMMKAFCCRCRLVGPGILNLKPESCSSLQRTCLQCSTSCSGRMRLFWQFWKYVMTEVVLKVVKVHWVPPTSYLTHSIVTGRMESHQSTHPFMHRSF